MKAVVITRPGGPDVMLVQERPVPRPGMHEVLLEVKAAGVNRPDVSQRKGHYPAPAGAPQDIPGLEVSGIVHSCGAGVTEPKVGDAVCALVIGGGYSEFVVAHEKLCLPNPAGWSFAQAASLPETTFTVWHNVFERGKLKAGERLLVHGGSSGIGITAIQVAKAFGAYVIVTTGSEEKSQACAMLGADQCINYKREDFECILKENGVDVILDMIGGEYVPRNIQVLRPEGRLVFINTMGGAKAQVNFMEIMRKRLTITGSTLRNREIAFKTRLAHAVQQNIWPVILAGKYRPVIYQEFSLADAGKAHEVMESSKHIGKIILVNG